MHQVFLHRRDNTPYLNKHKFQTYYHQQTCFTFTHITVRKHAAARSSICFRKGLMIIFFFFHRYYVTNYSMVWLPQCTLERVSTIRLPKTTPLSESVGLPNTALELLYMYFCLKNGLKILKHGLRSSNLCRSG